MGHRSNIQRTVNTVVKNYADYLSYDISDAFLKVAPEVANVISVAINAGKEVDLKKLELCLKGIDCAQSIIVSILPDLLKFVGEALLDKAEADQQVLKYGDDISALFASEKLAIEHDSTLTDENRAKKLEELRARRIEFQEDFEILKQENMQAQHEAQKQKDSQLIKKTGCLAGIISACACAFLAVFRLTSPQNVKQICKSIRLKDFFSLFGKK